MYQGYLWLVFSVGRSGTGQISEISACSVICSALVFNIISVTLCTCPFFYFSTVSSGLNSLAAVVLEDFMKPWCRSRHMELTEMRATLYSKFLGKYILYSPRTLRPFK